MEEHSQSRVDIDREAEDYVNSVMASQPEVTMRTPLPSGRKRSLSASAAETEVKKRKGEDQNTGRLAARARRSLLQSGAEHSQEEESETETGVTSPEKPKASNNRRRQTKATRKTKAGANAIKNHEPGQSKGSDNRRGNNNNNNNNNNNFNENNHDNNNKSNNNKNNNDASSNSINEDNDTDIMRLLRKMSDSMESMHTSLNKRIDFIAKMIEQSEKKITEKITDKMTKIIDKRINTEAAKLRQELDSRIQDLRNDFDREVTELNRRIENDQRGERSGDEGERHLRIVIRNLPETVNENTRQKVDSVIKDGMKIAAVNVVSAERKGSRTDSRPGVIIAKFRNSDDKKRVMSAKSSLRNSRQYGRVYINNDLSREERNMASNMRTLLNGVKRGQNLQVRGTRIVPAEDTGDRDDRRDGAREGRADGEHRAETYRSRNAEHVQHSDHRPSRNSCQRNGQRETNRGFSGDNVRWRDEYRRDQNPWNRQRH